MRILQSVSLVLVSCSLASAQSGGSPVLIDGATLVVGSFAGAPTAAGTTMLVWDGRSATNLMDNPGFEERPFGLRPWAQRIVERAAPVDRRAHPV